MLSELYKALSQHLAEKVPKLKRVTLWNGQMNDPEKHYELVTPAVFIEFSSVVWDNALRGIQTGELVLSIMIASNHLGDFAAGSMSQDLAIGSLVMLEDIQLALQGFSGALWSPLQRLTTEVDHDRDSIIAHTMTYRCTVTDPSADELCKLTEAFPQIVVHRDLDKIGPADASVD